MIPRKVFHVLPSEALVIRQVLESSDVARQATLQ